MQKFWYRTRITYKKDPPASKLLKHFTLARAVMDRLSGWRLDKPRNSPFRSCTVSAVSSPGAITRLTRVNTSHMFSHCHFLMNLEGSMQLPDIRPAARDRPSPIQSAVLKYQLLPCKTGAGGRATGLAVRNSLTPVTRVQSTCTKRIARANMKFLNRIRLERCSPSAMLWFAKFSSCSISASHHRYMPRNKPNIFLQI